MSGYSKGYGEFAPNSFSWLYIEKPALDKHLPASLYGPSAQILDIGSGTGRIIDYHLGRGALEVNMTGIDPDPGSIATTREKFPEATFINKAVQSVDLNTSFDIVTAQLSLHFLDNNDLARVCTHVSAALKPGGLFWILDDHPDRISLIGGFDRHSEEGWRTIPTRWGGSDSYFYRTLDRWKAAVAQSGLNFVVEECPIAEAGKANTEEFADYSRSHARFVILATNRP